METKLETVSSVTQKLTVEIPAEQVTKEINDYVSHLKKTITMKGFRKGKIPVTILKNKFKNEINQEVYKRLVTGSFSKSLEEEKLTPVTVPKIEQFGDIEEGKDFFYVAMVDSDPKVELKSYKGLKIEVAKRPPIEEQVNSELDKMANNSAQYEVVKEERAVKVGDFVEIDASAEVEGKSSGDLSFKGRLFEVGKKEIFEQVDEAMVGMTKGESKSVSIELPDDFSVEELRGKQAELKLDILELKERHVPGLDDEFAKRYGFDSFDKLKEDVKGRIAKEDDFAHQQTKQEKILKQIIDENPFEIPPSLVDQMLENFLYQSSGRPSYEDFQRMKPQIERLKNDEKIRGEVLPLIEFQLKSDYVIKEVADQEKIKVEDADLEKVYDEMAERMQLSKDELMKKVTAEVKQDIDRRIIRDKTLEVLLENAEVAESK